MIDLMSEDMEDFHIAGLTDCLSNEDLVVSQDCPICVRYNEVDLGRTNYGFNQAFKGNEANLYFQRMKEFSSKTVNSIVDEGDYTLHFHRTDIRGNLKLIFDAIDPQIAKQSNPLIFHFALDPDCTVTKADRKTDQRNPRIYFMVGYNGEIHILFFDPYHEINPY